MSAVGTGETHPLSARPALVTVVWTAAYVLASLLGRIIVVEPHHVGLVWPAAGVALVWLASAGPRRELVVDTVLLTAATMVVLGLTGSTTVQVLASVTTSVQTLVTLVLVRRWIPGVWGSGGRVPISQLPRFGLFLVAVAAGALVQSVLRTAIGVAFIAGEPASLFTGRFGRNAAAMATVGLCGVLIGGWVAQRRDAGRPVVPRPEADDLAHLLGATALTASIFVFGFALRPTTPTTYLLTLAVVWIAIRFGPVLTSVYCTLTGGVAVWLTIVGVGPISVVPDPQNRALLAQVLVVVLMVTGMAISLSREQMLVSVAELRRSESAEAMRAHELDLVMAHLDDGVAIIEQGGRIVHANAALRTAFGTRPVSEADRVSDDAARDDSERLRRGSDGALLTDEISPVTRALAGETVEAEEYSSPDQAGPIRWVEISGVPLPAEPGSPARAMVVVRDVSAEKLHQEELSNRAAELHLMIDRLTHGVAIVEDGGRYIHSNDALREIMTGSRDNDAFTGTVPPPTAYFLHHPDGRPVETAEYPYRRALDGEEVIAEEYHIRRPGVIAQQVIEISAYPLDVEPGARRRAMVVVRDITAEKAQQDSLVGFASTVAHDLNNPLSVIDGWAEAIEEDLGASADPVALTAAGMMQHIRGGVDQMRAFVADLLAHAVARDQSLRCEHVSLTTMVKHISATRDLPGQVDGVIETGDLVDVWGDRLLVRQVLDNLIGNGLKYVATGTVPTVHVAAEPIAPGWARVSVRDRGIGVAPAERQLVFETFHRASRSGYTGTGLGLAICKRIVERHGGTIVVEDNPDGIGSCFAFTLPTTPEAYAAAVDR